MGSIEDDWISIPVLNILIPVKNLLLTFKSTVIVSKAGPRFREMCRCSCFPHLSGISCSIHNNLGPDFEPNPLDCDRVQRVT